MYRYLHANPGVCRLIQICRTSYLKNGVKQYNIKKGKEEEGLSGSKAGTGQLKRRQMRYRAFQRSLTNFNPAQFYSEGKSLSPNGYWVPFVTQVDHTVIER